MPNPAYNTPYTALEWLKRQTLSFGNPEQIEAIELIAAAERLISMDIEEECDECDGEGTIEADVYCEKCGKPCDSCSTEDSCDECDGTGLIQYDRFLVYSMTTNSVYSKLDWIDRETHVYPSPLYSAA